MCHEALNRWHTVEYRVDLDFRNPLHTMNDNIPPQKANHQYKFVSYPQSNTFASVCSNVGFILLLIFISFGDNSHIFFVSPRVF